MDVGLGQGHIVLDGDPAPPRPNRGTAPNFRPMSIVAKRLDATWYGGRPRPRPHCAIWGAISPHKRGHSPQFSAHVCCGQRAGWIKMPLGTGNTGLMRTQLHPPSHPLHPNGPKPLTLSTSTESWAFSWAYCAQTVYSPAKLTYKRHVVGMSTSALK